MDLKARNMTEKLENMTENVMNTRGANRRQAEDRRNGKRRSELVRRGSDSSSLDYDRRSVLDRRNADRREARRRSLKERRNSAWRALEGT